MLEEEKHESPVLFKWVAIILWIAVGLQWAFLQNGGLIGSDHQQQANNSNLKITDPSSAPIILVGLPRSGSMAIHEYLQCQGMTSRHYCCHDDANKDAAEETMILKTSFPCPKNQKTCGDCVLENLKGTNKKAFDGCSSTATTTPPVQVWSAFDVETDQGWFLPQHFALGLLHQQYPNAIWILNKRTRPKDWAKSIYHWHGLTRRFLHSFGHLKQHDSTSSVIGIWDDVEPVSVKKPDRRAHVTAEQVLLDLERSVARNSKKKQKKRNEEIQSILEQIYQRHTDTIVNWSRQFPTHRLIEINVDEEEEDSSSSSMSSIQSRLDRAFGINYSSSSSQTTQDCRFQFDPPDNDWQDFSLPY